MGNLSTQRADSSKTRNINTQSNKNSPGLHDEMFHQSPNLLALQLQAHVLKALSNLTIPQRQLNYYFPVGHNQNSSLLRYQGKYSKQADFLMFRDQSTCIIQETREKVN